MYGWGGGIGGGVCTAAAQTTSDVLSLFPLAIFLASLSTLYFLPLGLDTKVNSPYFLMKINLTILLGAFFPADPRYIPKLSIVTDEMGILMLTLKINPICPSLILSWPYALDL